MANRQYRIPFNVLSFDKPRIMWAIERVLNRKDFILGREVKLLEAYLSGFMGANAVAVGNGTQAIELALRALELPSGSKVVTVANAGLPPVIAIARAGLTPMFCDVDDRGLMDPRSLKKTLEYHPDIKAVVPVHLYGQIFNVNQLDFFKGDVVEDACQAFGSVSEEYDIGARPESIVAMSFYPSKVLGAFGDAGAVLTKDEYYYDRIRSLRNFGVHPEFSVADGLGLYRGSMNSRMDTIQAAIILDNLKDYQSNSDKRTIFADTYNRLLPTALLHRPFSKFENHHLFTIRTGKRDKLIALASGKGIELRCHYPRPAYQNDDVPNHWHLPRTEQICREIVSLPLYPTMTLQDVQDVVDVIREVHDA